MLVSDVQQSDLIAHTIYTLFQIFSIIGYYTILNIFPCALQQVLVICFIYNKMYMLTPTSQIEVYVYKRCLSYL